VNDIKGRNANIKHLLLHYIFSPVVFPWAQSPTVFWKTPSLSCRCNQIEMLYKITTN